MGALALLMFLLLWKRGASSPLPLGDGHLDLPNPLTPKPGTGSQAAAQAAQQAAAQAAQKAAQTGHPADVQHAQQAAAVAKSATQAAQAEKAAAASSPAPWPQARPSGLPPWPSGWQPDNPPPAAVVTRAWQLLPTLWKRGAGATTVENTGGRWITYMAAWMNPAKTTKGVVAYRVKDGLPVSVPRPQPTANA